MSNSLPRIASFSTLIVFSLLLLIGPLHAFAVKGFAPILALAGVFGLIAVISKRPSPAASPFDQQVKGYGYALVFMAYAFFAVFWSSYEGAMGSYLTATIIVAFTIAVVKTINQSDSNQRRIWQRLLIASMVIGCIFAMIIGPYNVYWPRIAADLNYPFELIRQVNRSLTILPIILMLLGAAMPRHYRWLVVIGLACGFVTTYYSNSQSSLLALCIGSAGMILAYIAAPLARLIIWSCLALALLSAPVLHIASFENKWVENYAPKIFIQKGAAQERQWLFYVYAKESLKKPFIGHGLRSSRSFEPASMKDYIAEGEARGGRVSTFVRPNKNNAILTCTRIIYFCKSFLSLAISAPFYCCWQCGKCSSALMTVLTSSINHGFGAPLVLASAALCSVTRSGKAGHCQFGRLVLSLQAHYAERVKSKISQKKT